VTCDTRSLLLSYGCLVVECLVMCGCIALIKYALNHQTANHSCSALVQLLGGEGLCTCFGASSLLSIK
jgi:hypothetical protein